MGATPRFSATAPGVGTFFHRPMRFCAALDELAALRQESTDPRPLPAESGRGHANEAYSEPAIWGEQSSRRSPHLRKPANARLGQLGEIGVLHANAILVRTCAKNNVLRIAYGPIYPHLHPIETTQGWNCA